MSGLVLAPFSNSDIRDWPAAHWRSLIARLLEATDEGVEVVGAGNQRLRGAEVVRPFPADRVVNACGRLTWTQLQPRLAGAACVVGNNSGVAHLSALYGAPTVCVFGGAHPRRVWRPSGPRVVLLTRAIGCSPCGLHVAGDCPHGLACLEEIAPDRVARAVLSLMAVRTPDDAGARAVEVPS